MREHKSTSLDPYTFYRFYEDCNKQIGGTCMDCGIGIEHILDM